MHWDDSPQKVNSMLHKIALLYRTVIALKTKQIIYQIKKRLLRPKYRLYSYTSDRWPIKMDVKPIWKGICLNERSQSLSFLNIEHPFMGWCDTSQGMLWAYNLNYMDWLCQKDMDYATGKHWIDNFITELPTNQVGLDSYPIALRGINWIKFFIQHADKISKEQWRRWNDSLYSQYILLNKKLEYHLLGNHLLEDVYSLYIAAIYFGNKDFYQKATRILKRELNEQVLPDGAHFEQSPMYHCILLDRLLDCCNVSFHNPRFTGQEQMNTFLKAKAIQMLGHLQSMIYADGTIPLLNDSAYGIAPVSDELFAYARRLRLTWQAIPLKECGYRKLSNKRMEGILDVGGIMASYQPGHSHADMFNYELRIDGKPFIVDTGISTYNKTERRLLERGTSAHNTVTIGGKNSSEVWSGFRMGKRAQVTLLEDLRNRVKACHNGFGKKYLHTRLFHWNENLFEIEDRISFSSKACSYIHFAPNVSVEDWNKSVIHTDRARIDVVGASLIEITDGTVSCEYNQFMPIKIAKIYFTEFLRYTVSL